MSKLRLFAATAICLAIVGQNAFAAGPVDVHIQGCNTVLGGFMTFPNNAGAVSRTLTFYNPGQPATPDNIALTFLTDPSVTATRLDGSGTNSGGAEVFAIAIPPSDFGWLLYLNGTSHPLRVHIRYLIDASTNVVTLVIAELNPTMDPQQSPAPPCP